MDIIPTAVTARMNIFLCFVLKALSFMKYRKKIPHAMTDNHKKMVGLYEKARFHRKVKKKKNARVIPHPGQGYPVIIEIGHILLNRTCNNINPKRTSKADRAYFLKSL